MFLSHDFPNTTKVKEKKTNSTIHFIATARFQSFSSNKRNENIIRVTMSRSEDDPVTRASVRAIIRDRPRGLRAI